MRLIYAVSGEGMGHATRSKALLDELSKQYDILILTDNRAYHYLKKHFPKVINIQMLHISYINNEVSTLRTGLLNLSHLPKFIVDTFKVWKILKRFKPHLIINDFTVIPNYLALFKKIPIITIDNQHIISKTHINFHKKHLWDYIKSKLVIKLIVPKANLHLTTTFFYPKKKTNRLHLFPPIIRNEIRNIKPKKKNHVLVYQTSNSNKRLLTVLQDLDENFIIYGMNGKKQLNNLALKEFNESEFFEDLGNCKAVIANGSFSLMTEALYLNKPVLTIPVKKQFEQIINAIYLEKAGYGVHLERTNKIQMELFLSNLHRYEENLKNYPREDNSKILKKINDLAHKLL